MPLTDDEIRRLVEHQRQQASMIERMQFEVTGHIRDMVRPIGDFYKYVMDPMDGLIVKHRNLEDRLLELENAARDGKDRRRWVMRDLIGVGAMLIVTAFVSAFLAVKLFGK